MSAIADDIGVNRVTLYRWVGSRDQLLVEVVWSLAADALRLARRRAGVGGMVETLTGFLGLVIENPAMRRWLSEDGEHAMRLLTRREPGFQPRLIAAVQSLLQEEVARGTLAVPVAVEELAYVIVRLIESYAYMDLITGERPDAARAEPILRMLLRVDQR
jgi:AcrR family transcriptional regulator